MPGRLEVVPLTLRRYLRFYERPASVRCQPDQPIDACWQLAEVLKTPRVGLSGPEPIAYQDSSGGNHLSQPTEC